MAWAFFRSYYLMGLPLGIWYPNPVYPSPPAHYKLVHDWEANHRTITVFPRSFGKSILKEENILLDALTLPGALTLSIHSLDTHAQSMTTKIMSQITDNPRISEDFGNLKPEKGSGRWSKTHMWLRNGFQLVAMSAMSKMVGLHPWKVWCDDVEFQGQMQMSQVDMAARFEGLVRHHILPMLDPGAYFHMIGTLHTRKFFIYRAAKATVEEEPWVGLFHRTIYGGFDESGQPLWPEKFGEDRMRGLRVLLEDHGFQAQIMNDPGGDEDRVLPLHEKWARYVVANPDQALADNPLQSRAELVAWVPGDPDPETSIPTPKEIRRDFGEATSGMYRLLVADPIHSVSNKSDYSCVMVVGVDQDPAFKDHWWLLDMRHGRVNDNVFIDWIWELGLRWKVRVCGIEAVAAQQKLVDRAREDFALRAEDAEWMPRVYPIKYKGKDFGSSKEDISKPARISRLIWRFEQSRIKFPSSLWEGAQPYEHLRRQIGEFNGTTDLMVHDDALDTLAMVSWVHRPRGSYGDSEEATSDTMVGLIEQGIFKLPGTNIPIIPSVGSGDLTPKAIDVLASQVMERIWASKEQALKNARNPRYRKRGIHGMV